MQTLTLERRTADSFTVVKAVGEIDLETQDHFERAVSQLLSSSPVVIDLSRVDFLAISALRSLLVCQQLAQSLGRELFFAEPSPQTLRLLEVSGLDAVLPMAPTVAQVVCTSPAGGDLVDHAGRDLAQLDVV